MKTGVKSGGSSLAHLNSPIGDGFLQSAERHPERPALELDKEVWTYARLRDRALSIASTLQQSTPVGGESLTGVLAHRSATGFAGILAALLAGNGYVPLNRTFPTTRTRWMLHTSDCRSLIVDEKSEGLLPVLLEGLDRKMLVVLPDREGVCDLAELWPRHTFVGAQDLSAATGWKTQPAAADATAYLLFTSGSTGIPKGVGVTHKNVAHFVQSATTRYEVTTADRFTQMFDITFDLSVFDMFVAWHSGACVCCPSEHDLLNPDKFVRESKPTVWLSVPSAALFMKRFGALKPNRYPSLRWSLFCGEPLPVDVAEAWAAAAPHSILENLYGPTEVTVACTAYRWNSARPSSEFPLGIVPIGHPMTGMCALIVDETLSQVAPGDVGELLVSGPQVTPGYWRNDEATARSYVRLKGHETVFYRTGDRVRQPVDNGPITFVGRLDGQVKILGHRVELGEVEARLREVPGVASAAAVAWPVTQAGAGGVVAFVTGTGADSVAVRSNLLSRLPPYAVPRAVHVLSDLPQTANGKVDRQALLSLLKNDSSRC